MIIFFFLLGLIIAIFVLSIQYFKAYAKLKSHSDFNHEAKRVLGNIKYSDPKITCDFCGGQIDTVNDQVCPHCGASYAYDSEWLERHNVIDQNMVDTTADYAAKQEISRVQKEIATTAKRLRIAIITLVSILVGFIILAILVYVLEPDHHYLKANELNQYSFEEYQEVDYEIVGDGILLDYEGIKVTLDKIYLSHDSIGEKNDYKIAYHIENNSKLDVKLSFHPCAINNYSFDGIFYEWVKHGTDIIYYSKLSTHDDPVQIYRLIYNDIEIYNDEYRTLYERSTPMEFSTTAVNAEPLALPTEDIIYENDYIIVTSDISDYGVMYENDLPRGYNIYVYNKTDAFFKIRCDQAMLNDTPIDISSAYDEPLFDNCMCTFESRCYDDIYEERSANDIVSINLKLTCDENPTLDFSTGYIQIN